MLKDGLMLTESLLLLCVTKCQDADGKYDCAASH